MMADGGAGGLSLKCYGKTGNYKLAIYQYSPIYEMARANTCSAKSVGGVSNCSNCHISPVDVLHNNRSINLIHDT